MVHSTDTPKQFTAVSGHTRLFRREGGMYYLRAKVPYELRAVIGKTEIRKSLRTSTLKEALPKLKVESLKVDREFSLAEEKKTGRKAVGPELSQELVAWLTSKYFVQLEQERSLHEAQSEDWTEQERQEVADTRKEDLMTLQIDSVDHARKNTRFLDAFLEREMPDLAMNKESADYRRLLNMFRRATEESGARYIHHLERKPALRREFGILDAHSLLPSRPEQHRTPFGKFLDEFMDYQAKTHADTTPSAYKLPVRILRETIGETTSVHEITRQDVERACEIMRQTPFNVTQRYRGLSIAQAIEAARRAGDNRVISPRTNANYFMLMSAIFNYAEEEQLIPQGSNPTKSRRLREMFRLQKKPSKKDLFSDQELQAIFNAPLYMGCLDDEWRYSQTGPNVVKRGRFWVPLIGLFQGLRCNEACQLYAQDVGEESGILYLNVREDLEDGVKAPDKSIKNSASWRKIPVHPMLLALGFKEFVERRRKDDLAGRLFPELKIGKSKNRYSACFSKWFGRFIEQACGCKPKATFHSFRHHFRSALIRAKVSIEAAEALGGWKAKGSSEYEYRHVELPQLLQALTEVRYPELDLSHLQTDNEQR